MAARSKRPKTKDPKINTQHTLSAKRINHSPGSSKLQTCNKAILQHNTSASDGGWSGVLIKDGWRSNDGQSRVEDRWSSTVGWKSSSGRRPGDLLMMVMWMFGGDHRLGGVLTAIGGLAVLLQRLGGGSVMIDEGSSMEAYNYRIAAHPEICRHFEKELASSVETVFSLLTACLNFGELKNQDQQVTSAAQQSISFLPDALTEDSSKAS
ncbi:hypothetical protein M5K25_016185 [Dendrobium thyrsiflorum]|uniref:Uncharacterized protein n=1 Tax=Dendrobium thyrsiflorum TaxID=117978 RepID=A0ABD0UJ03_DENTH